MFAFKSYGQEFAAKGKVVDAESGETLIGAIVFDSLTKKGTITNDFGFFQLDGLRNRIVSLQISYLGYNTLFIKQDTENQGDFIVAKLTPLSLSEFVVQSERLIDIRSGSAITINNPAELPLPTFKTEIDILDVIQNQPGVQRSLEGSIGFSTRGGNLDQNLMLMDGIPVYNSGHFGGFVSIFDPFAISNLTFYKGGFPAKFGGRVSSVLDVHLKTGDMQSYHGELKLGPLFSKVSFEGPIVKDKSSFLVSYRRSIFDLVLGSIYLFSKPEEKYGLRFHDLTVKLNHQFSSKSSIYFSLYQGRDRINETLERSYFSGDQPSSFAFQRSNSWGNLFANLRWGKVLSDRLHLNVSGALSNYGFDYSQEDLTKRDESIFTQNINNYGVYVKDYLIKSEAEYYFRKNLRLDFGAQLILHDFTPVDSYQYKLDNFGLGETERRQFVNLNAQELFGYVQASIQNQKGNLNIRPGLRFGTYSIESATFSSVQPRMQITFQMNPELGLELDYSNTFQPVHSLNSSGTSLSPNIWIPATEKLAPVESDAISFSINTTKKIWSAGAAAFFRTFNNLIEIDRNNGFAIAKEDWEESILAGGSGRAYGIELNGDRRFERARISGNYTYSRSFREFVQINNGNEFPFNFDRPHSFKLEASYKISENSSLSMLGNIRSGQPFTLTNQSSYSITNGFYSKDRLNSNSNNWGLDSTFPVFFQETLATSEINNLRMPVYHRVDLAFSNLNRWKNGVLREWNISVYNVYNRKNAYYIYLNTNSAKFEQFTLMPIFLSFSYNLKF